MPPTPSQRGGGLRRVPTVRSETRPPQPDCRELNKSPLRQYFSDLCNLPARSAGASRSAHRKVRNTVSAGTSRCSASCSNGEDVGARASSPVCHGWRGAGGARAMRSSSSYPSERGPAPSPICHRTLAITSQTKIMRVLVSRGEVVGRWLTGHKHMCAPAEALRRQPMLLDP